MKKIVFTSALVGLVAMHSFAADLPSKSGFLLGLDWNLGVGKGNSVATDTPAGGRPAALSPEFTGYFDNETLSNTFKLVVGYQRYSQNLSMLGFNIKGKVGLGFGQMTSVLRKNVDNNGTSLSGDGEGVVTSYVPLTLGIEANFLVDFVESGEHVFGGSVGLGYEFVHGMGVANSFKNVKANATSLFSKVFNANGIDYSVISPKIGLHYYYQNHQVGLDVSFDKALQKGVTRALKPAGNPNAYSEQALTTNYGYLWTIGFNYAYRF